MIIFRTIPFYLALAGLGLVAFFLQKTTVSFSSSQDGDQAIIPFGKMIATAGIIEPIDKNIEMGVPQSGLVKDVYVKVGDKVEAGDILFRLDDRDLLAQLLVQKAQVAVSLANLDRLSDQLSRLEMVEDPRAVSQDELYTRRADVALAKAQLEAAEAGVVHTMIMLDRLSIKAPRKGVILDCRIQKGEFLSAGGSTAIVLGNLDHLHVRAVIDEQHASDIHPHAAAFTFPKNQSSVKIPLHFERIEPYVVPKRSFTGGGKENGGNKVLQVIYSFDRTLSYPLYVGQQINIYIERNQDLLTVQSKEIASDAR